MKTVLFLVLFSAMAFAEENTISADRKTFLKDALTEAYGQEVVAAAKEQEEAEAEIMAVLPEKLLECALNANCNDIVAAAKEGGLTQAQVESAMKEIKAEDIQDALNETVQASLAHVYGGEAGAESSESEVMAELPEALSGCRENDSGTVNSLIPDVFQASLCSDVIGEAMEAGVSYAMAKKVLEGLTVDEAADTEKKPRTVAKP